MDPHRTENTPVMFSRTQSNHNLSCYVDYSCDEDKTNSKEGGILTKKQKLDNILNTLKSFKNSQSTNDLHCASRLSAKFHTINNPPNPKEEKSFVIEKEDPIKIRQAPISTERKYKINGFNKNGSQNDRKEEHSFCSELKHVMSSDALRKVKFGEHNKTNISIKNTARHDVSFQGGPNLKFSLQNQKNSLEAIKQKLQKYGINVTKNNQQSRLRLNETQNDIEANKKFKEILKSPSNNSLKSSQLLIPSMTSHLNIKSKATQIQQHKHEDHTSRPLTSLKQKDVSFHQQFSESSANQLKNNYPQIRISVNQDTDEKRTSPIKSFTSSNSMTSAKAHAKIFNLNMENFTGEGYDFGVGPTLKKPGSYGSNQKSKLTDSDDYSAILKQKPGSYGNKKTLKEVFQPTSSFSKNSNVSSYEITDLGLKQTIQTDCTYTKIQKKLTIKDFTLGRQIGKGKFGRVFLCTHNLTGFISAIKIIKKEMIRKQRNIEQLIREIKIQMFLNHSNSVKMYGFFDDSQNIYLLIEYCMEGQLYTLLKTKKRFEEQEAIPIIKDICEGLNYLHSQNIIHRDIKPQNIVLSFQLSKLCDFGWSVNSQNEKRQTFCGTPLYVSPELLMGKTYDYKVDIWALGIMVYELLTGKLPFHITNEKQLRKIVTKQVKYPEHLSQNAKNFIQHLLQKNPEYRNDMQTILKHKFLIEGLQKIKNKSKNG